MRLIATALLATFWITSASAQEPMLACLAKYHTSTVMNDVAPGMLGAFKNRPCIHAVHIGGIGARAPSTGGIARMEFVERPRYGKIRAENRAAFVFRPDQNFSGADSMLVRFHMKSGKTMSVRFAITVS